MRIFPSFVHLAFFTHHLLTFGRSGKTFDRCSLCITRLHSREGSFDPPLCRPCMERLLSERRRTAAATFHGAFAEPSRPPSLPSLPLYLSSSLPPSFRGALFSSDFPGSLEVPPSVPPEIWRSHRRIIAGWRHSAFSGNLLGSEKDTPPGGGVPMEREVHPTLCLS